MPLPTDTLLSQQWHLHNTVAGLLDLNVFGVWSPATGPAYTGAGIRAVVIDDGFDFNHQDFDHYNQAFDFDFEVNLANAFGNAAEGHGTSVAGIIGAAADGTGAVGVAFDTDLVGYRTTGLISDAWLQDIRDAISTAATVALGDVANISQGIGNDVTSMFGVGYDPLRFDEIETSIATAVNDGRGGFGMSIVKAAGNSRADNYDVNADDWTNDTRQIVVGAVDQNGFVSSYSSYGTALLVSAFGTPGEVVTTDRVGAAGTDPGDFTSTFNGTSSAAPMVTGVVSLMYDANAGLGWRDVQSILAVSARQVGSEVGAGTAGAERFAWEFNGANTWNGGGQHFSLDYGYGLVDALAATRLAESWLLTGTQAAVSNTEVSNTMDVINATTIIPDGDTIGQTFSGNAGFDDAVERVTVEMAFSSTFTGDLEVYLTSPSGTVSRLIADTGGNNDFSGVWTFESQAFRGERAGGQWSVRVVDDSFGDALTVTDIVIRTFGAESTDDRYIFTNEYSDYVGTFGHLLANNDSNGGADTVNAAAVTSASTINLGGTSTIDGVGGITFANIENAIGGEAGDNMTGNANANKLFGMRGNDVLNGGVDNVSDTLAGGFGDDTYIINSVTDIVVEAVGEGAGDRVSLNISYGLAAGVNVETLTATTASAAAINLTGNEIAQLIIGNDGINILNGGIDNLADTLIGGLGNDVYVINSENDVVVESVGQGTNDRVSLNVSYALAAGVNVETMTATTASAANINLTGNEIAQTIFGNDGINVINGGIDNLADTLVGGLGNDVYIINSANDIILENAGQGTADRASLNVSYVLAAGVNVETLTASTASAAAINLTGNEIAQLIIGNDGINILNGGIDNLADTLIGGLGNDVYVINSENDIVMENAGQGTNDRVSLNVSYALAAGVNVETMTATTASAANINLTGNEIAQTIFGNDGINIINGGIDNLADTLVGGLGNDVYIINSANDIILENAGQGTGDRASLNVAYVLAAGVNVETLTASTSSAATINLTGNEIAQLIIGNANANILNGAGGNDTLTGGLGADTFLFNTALNAATNLDTITDFNVAADTIQLENTGIFSALGAGLGVLDVNMFKNLTTGGAVDQTDRILYDDVTGALFYDSDGNGGTAAIQFATLTGSPTVFFDDFVVV